MDNLSEGIIFGLDNPLLDICAEVSVELLKKYNLKSNNAILGNEDLLPILDDLTQNYKVEYVAGGSTQNVFRVIQWILKRPNLTTFVGMVGKDVFAKALETCAKEDGVNVQYEKIPKPPTGACTVLVTGRGSRSLVTFLGAAAQYKREYLDKPETVRLMEKAKYFYISGFFLAVSPDSILHIAKYACDNNKVFMMHLSASYVPEKYSAELAMLMPYIDILFGNASEAKQFAKVQNMLSTSVEDIAKKTVQLPKKNPKRGRMVVFTQGKGPVVVADVYGVRDFPIQIVPADTVIDKNGAGDAFVGGFLSQYVIGKSIEECAKCGSWASGEIIQHRGCTFEKQKSYGDGNRGGNKLSSCCRVL